MGRLASTPHCALLSTTASVCGVMQASRLLYCTQALQTKFNYADGLPYKENIKASQAMAQVTSNSTFRLNVPNTSYNTGVSSKSSASSCGYTPSIILPIARGIGVGQGEGQVRTGSAAIAPPISVKVQQRKYYNLMFLVRICSTVHSGYRCLCSWIVQPKGERPLCILYQAYRRRPRAVGRGGGGIVLTSNIRYSWPIVLVVSAKIGSKTLCVHVLHAFLIVRPSTARDPGHRVCKLSQQEHLHADGQSLCSLCQGRVIFFCR